MEKENLVDEGIVPHGTELFNDSAAISHLHASSDNVSPMKSLSQFYDYICDKHESNNTLMRIGLDRDDVIRLTAHMKPTAEEKGEITASGKPITPSANFIEVKKQFIANGFDIVIASKYRRSYLYRIVADAKFVVKLTCGTLAQALILLNKMIVKRNELETITRTDKEHTIQDRTSESREVIQMAFDIERDQCYTRHLFIA